MFILLMDTVVQENQQWLRCFLSDMICYFAEKEWLNMTPEEHWNWTNNVSQECIEIEILKPTFTIDSNEEKVLYDLFSQYL